MDDQTIDPRVLTRKSSDSQAQPQAGSSSDSRQIHTPSQPQQTSPNWITPGASSSYAQQQQQPGHAHNPMQHQPREQARAAALARANQTMSSLYGSPLLQGPSGSASSAVNPHWQSGPGSVAPQQTHQQAGWAGAMQQQQQQQPTAFNPPSRALQTPPTPPSPMYQYSAAVVPSLSDIDEQGDDSNGGRGKGKGRNSGRR